jgi:pilus assembly protein Flp/PilA
VHRLPARADLRADRRAVTALEHGLIAALIAVVVIGTISALGSSLKISFSTVSSVVAAHPSRMRRCAIRRPPGLMRCDVTTRWADGRVA